MNNYRSNNRKHRFKSNNDRNFRKRPINPHKNQNEFNSNIDFRHRNPGRNNQNASKLIDSIVKLKPSSTKGSYLKSISISSTMSSSIKIDKSSISNL